MNDAYCKIYPNEHFPNKKNNSLARRKYIASNLQNSQVEVCFCALRNTPVDLTKVYYLESFAIVITIIIIAVLKVIQT